MEIACDLKSVNLTEDLSLATPVFILKVSILPICLYRPIQLHCYFQHQRSYFDGSRNVDSGGGEERDERLYLLPFNVLSKFLVLRSTSKQAQSLFMARTVA